MQFATGDGRAAGHIGAVLVLDAAPGFSVPEARRVLAERIRAVPRLRQRLHRAPPGCGRPYWADDPAFGWRFARYYRGDPAYRRKGAPPLLLRLLGPAVVILTVVLLASGVGLLLVGPSWLPLLLKVHKASFVLWFGAMTIHVLSHLGEVFRLAPRDWVRRTRRDVTGAAPRQWLIAVSLVAGGMLGFLLLSHVGHWLASSPGG